MRDGMNCINPRPAIDPAAAHTDNTAWTSTILDLLGFDSATLLISVGALADADATFAVALTESDANDMSGSNAVAAQDLIGTLALASFDHTDGSKCFKLGYQGNHRYIRATVTPASNAGNAFVSAIWLLSHAAAQPTDNPPT